MILGIDPGLTNTGYAVLEETGNKKQETNYKLVECGVIKIDQKSKTRLPDGQVKNQKDNRLVTIYEGLEKIIKKYPIKRMAVETLFFAKNAKSAMAVAEAIGVVKLCGLRYGLEVVGYTPLQIKMALVGYGRAEKQQVEAMVRNELGLEEPILFSHASDAAAVALTDGLRMKLNVDKFS